MPVLWPALAVFTPTLMALLLFAPPESRPIVPPLLVALPVFVPKPASSLSVKLPEGAVLETVRA